jgi:hypothetical protein
MYNPAVNYLRKVREKELPGSAVVLVRLMALDTLDFQPGLLGFAYFHLGFDEEGGVVEHEGEGYFLITGHFQLPIYWGDPAGYLSGEQLQSDYAAIPCASILMSVGQGQGSLPEYGEGAYNTVFFPVGEVEFRLFQEQARRERLATLDYVQAYYKFKGISAKEHSEEQLRKLLAQALAFNQENASSLLSLQAMAEYSSAFGVTLALDALLVPSHLTDFYYFCTACLFPPARYYAD